MASWTPIRHLQRDKVLLLMTGSMSQAQYHGGIKIPPQVIALDVKTQIVFTLFQQLKLAAFFGEKISQFAFCATELFGYVSFARDKTVILQAAWHILFLLHSMVL